MTKEKLSTEQQRIIFEEEYREEIKRRISSKSIHTWLQTLFTAFQALAIIFGIIFSVVEYWRSNRIEAENATRDYRKYFYEKQFDTYQEAIETCSILATETKSTDAYKNARDKFNHLYWGRMSSIQNRNVEEQMSNIRVMLNKIEQVDTNPSFSYRDILTGETKAYQCVEEKDLRGAVLTLTRLCRNHMIESGIQPEDAVHYNKY